jgi:hypothetical protein
MGTGHFLSRVKSPGCGDIPTLNHVCMLSQCCLGGVMVSVLNIGLKVNGFKPSGEDAFLKAIKICSTPSFRWEVKPSASCYKALLHIKNHFKV